MAIKELNWWLELAQKDLDKVHPSTMRRLMAEFHFMLNDPATTAFYKAKQVDQRDFRIVADYLKEQFEAMKRGDEVHGSYTVREVWSGKGLDEGDVGGSEHWMDTDKYNYEEKKNTQLKYTTMAMFLKEWREAELIPEQIVRCKRCGKFTIQKGKMKKVYCSAVCKTEDKKGGK